MKFYVEWKDAYDPYDFWIKDSHVKFETFEEAVAHCLKSLNTYSTLEHRIRVKGHRAVTMAKF